MKVKHCALSALFLVLVPTLAFTQNKVIYGSDDRKDVFEVTDLKLRELARSTAARIAPSHIKGFFDSQVRIQGRKLWSEMICQNEQYANQLAVADCSGFLVGKDLLMTAGHCMEDMYDCRSNRWVFDYKVDPTSDSIIIPETSVYKCKEIIASKDDYSSMMDYALIRLDREVTDREPLEIRKTGKVEKGRELVIIGHPSGLPSKIADNAFVRNNNHPSYFSANLDSYGGNSGAAVIDRETGIVEGILVRGEEDYNYDRRIGCRISNRCKNDECMGEEITRLPQVISEIAELNKSIDF